MNLLEGYFWSSLCCISGLELGFGFKSKDSSHYIRWKTPDLRIISLNRTIKSIPGNRYAVFGPFKLSL